MKFLYEIILDTNVCYEAFADESLQLKEGDDCLIKKERVVDYGTIKKCIGELSNDKSTNDIPEIDTKASIRDKSKANENRMRAKSAFRTAVGHIENLGLKMKLLNAHYSFDKKLATFQFTADGRIDFRQLVKDLSQSLNTRIELRQIGVRDETAVLGGFGVCGQELCCKRYLKKFDSINVKMAKEQDLSLNPVNISGMCGRLKCCLKYEHEGYVELDKNMPRRGAFCECEEGVGKIIDRNLLTQKVTVYIDECSKCISCAKEEVRVIYPDKYKISGIKDDSKDSNSDDSIPQEVFELDDSEEMKKKKRK